MAAGAGRALRIAIVAGEASGDLLGAALIQALRAGGHRPELGGVGGEAMVREGFASLFPQSDIAVMGLGPVIRRLPLLLRRISETVRHVEDFAPDILVTIDSPDFSKRVARRVRRRVPAIPIVHWVCPSVWAWRPGRAPAMRPYIDRILCLLPFEPAALMRLNGPQGVFVGHPAIERLGELRPRDPAEQAARADPAAPHLLVLPGSRLSVIRRMLPLFVETLRQPAFAHLPLNCVIPTFAYLAAPIRALLGPEADRFNIVTGEAAKLAAFRSARAALAASGTVTLELALAGIPLVAAYKVAGWEAAIARRLVKVPSAILPNLILGENVVPEFIQEAAEPLGLSTALLPLLGESPARQAQLDAFGRLEQMMGAGGPAPSARAASAVLAMLPRDHLAMHKQLG